MFISGLIALNYRISIEERALIEEFGKQCTDYKSRGKNWCRRYIDQHL